MSPENPLLDTVAGFLRAHMPFDGMAKEHVHELAGSVRMRYLQPGDTLLAPADGPPEHAWIVFRGRVERTAADAFSSPSALAEPLQAGELFPVTAVLDRRPVAFTYRALGDLFVYELDGDLLRTLVERSPPLRAYCNHRLRTLLEQSRALLQARYNEQSSAEQSMTTPLADLPTRPPLSCSPGATVGQALLLMQREKIGSLVMVDGDAVPLGIITERDVVRHAALGTLDREAPVRALMTPEVVTLPEAATVGDAVLCMVRHGIRHVVVTRGGRFSAILSQRDVFSLQRLSFFRLASRIEASTDIDDLAIAAADIHVLARNLLAQGVAAEALTRFISELNDHVVRRVLDLAQRNRPVDDLSFGWIALGSEGRREQTIATDQDNAMVFLPSGVAGAHACRARLLPFAKAVNAGLDRCGFPLCRGDIMAGNPRWCLSVDEWRGLFSGWLRNPGPTALLNANIFFDLRPIGAGLQAVTEMREWLAGAAAQNRAFLHQMARNALETRPPLNWLGGLAGSGRGDSPDAIDLKLHGSRLFVDAARILALAHGVTETGTAARLRAAADRGGLPRDEAEAAIDAFHILQQFRLRLQFGDPAAVPDSPNAVLPARLNEFDRRLLKETLFQARRLQQVLAVEYRA